MMYLYFMDGYTADPTLEISNYGEYTVSLDALTDVGHQHQNHSDSLASEDDYPVLDLPLDDPARPEGVADEDGDDDSPDGEEGYSDPVFLFF